MNKNQGLEEFLTALSSKAPVPGGGGASAYTAALGMSLGSMVANLTTGKKKYAQYQKELDELIEKMNTTMHNLFEYVEKDALAFEPLSKAYSLPKSTDDELKIRNEILEKALEAASIVPLELMNEILASMKLLKRMTVIGSRMAISDVGVGIQFAKAALNGASLNVFINTKLMLNREKAEELNDKADLLLVQGNELADEVYEAVIECVR